MLVPFRGGVVFLRVGIMAVGLAMAIASQFAPGLPWWAVFSGAAVFGFGIATSKRLMNDAGALVIQGFFGSTRLRPGAAFGHRTSNRGKAAVILVYVTDGDTEVELMELMPLGTGKAKRIIARLEKLLFSSNAGQGPVAPPRPEAAAAVNRDLEQMAQTQAVIDSYYSSPERRRVTLILGLLIGTFVVTMSVLLALGIIQ